jgi:predicted aspartyl protease
MKQRNYPIERSISDEGIILFDAMLDNVINSKLVFDTGASHTTIDSNALVIAGYDISNSINEVQVETSNGVIEVSILILKKIEAFGIIKHNFPVQMYDFFAHGIVSEYEGILGLDFLDKEHFCLNLDKNEITIFAK